MDHGKKSKYIHSNDGALTRWRHHVNESLHNPIITAQCSGKHTNRHSADFALSRFLLASTCVKLNYEKCSRKIKARSREWRGSDDDDVLAVCVTV